MTIAGTCIQLHNVTLRAAKSYQLWLSFNILLMVSEVKPYRNRSALPIFAKDSTHFWKKTIWPRKKCRRICPQGNALEKSQNFQEYNFLPSITNP